MTEPKTTAEATPQSDILGRMAKAKTRVSVVCPYLTSQPFAAAFTESTAASKRLVTRLNRNDIATGATNLARVLDAFDAGAEVRVLDGVHAKVYVLDNWAYVGSANLSNGGLAPGLREFGVASGSEAHVAEAAEYFDAVWASASPITRSEVQSVQVQLEGLRDEVDAARSLQREAAARLLLPVLGRPPARAKSSAAPKQGGQGVGVEEFFMEWTGSEAGARALARIIASAIRTVPNFRTSEHWTLTFDAHRQLIRLNLGMVEVLTLTSSGGFHCVGLPNLLSPEALERLRKGGATLEPNPYKNVARLAPEAGYVVLPPTQIVEVENDLSAGLNSFVALDKATGRSQHRHALSLDGLGAVARLSRDAELEQLALTLRP